MDFKFEENTIVLGNCLDVLKTIPDKTFDAIITDPPFGIGFLYQNREVYDNPEDYWNWLSEIYVELLRVSKNGSFFAIWQSQKYMRYYWNWFGDNIRIYIGAKNFVQLRKTAINYGYDPIVVFYNGQPELRPVKPKRNLDFFVANTAKFVTQTKSLARKHPCPRPIDQTIQLVDNFVLENGLVLDCFMGSGTTGLACKLTNRRYFGIELNHDYQKLAIERIRTEIF